MQTMQCSKCEFFKNEVVFCRNGHALCVECNNLNGRRCLICSASLINCGSVLEKREFLERTSQKDLPGIPTTSNEILLNNVSTASEEVDTLQNACANKSVHRSARISTKKLKPTMQIRCKETDSEILMRHLAEFRIATQYKTPEKIDVYVRSCGPDKFRSVIFTKSKTGLDLEVQNVSPSCENIENNEEEISTGMNPAEKDATEEKGYVSLDRDDCTTNGCKTCMNKFNNIISDSQDAEEQDFWIKMYEKVLKFDVPCMKDASIQVNIV